MSRRDLLRGGVVGAGLLALPRFGGGRSTDAGVPISMAMHLHGSFSETRGSWDGHLSEADANGVDVV